MTSTDEPQTLRRSRGKSSVLSRSEPMLWLTGGGLIVSLAMIIWLIAVDYCQRFADFLAWPGANSPTT